MSASGHLDLVARCKQFLDAFILPAGDIAEPNGDSQCVTIAARGEMANDAAFSNYGLVVKEKPFGVGELELQKPARQAFIALAQHCLAPDEVAEPAGPLIRADGEAKSRFEHVILIGDVMAEMTIGLFEAQCVHCQQSRGPKLPRLAGLQQNRKNVL